MQISIRTGVPVPAHQLAAKANPEYTKIADQMKAMAIGDSFEVSEKEAATVRYIAKANGISLTSRTLPSGNIGFWKKEFEAPKPRKPRTPKVKADVATEGATAPATAAANAPVEDNSVEVDVTTD